MTIIKHWTVAVLCTTHFLFIKFWHFADVRCRPALLTVPPFPRLYFHFLHPHCVAFLLTQGLSASSSNLCLCSTSPVGSEMVWDHLLPFLWPPLMEWWLCSPCLPVPCPCLAVWWAFDLVSCLIETGSLARNIIFGCTGWVLGHYLRPSVHYLEQSRL